MTALWPHQQRARAGVIEAWREGARRVLVVCPTGGGKTMLGADIARSYIFSHAAAGGRVTWLAHRGELVTQAVRTLRGLGLQAEPYGIAPSAPVQVCTLQTLLARGEVPQATLVVADEAHHFAEDNDWTRVLLAYVTAGARVLGLTATPQRGDGKALGRGEAGFERLVVAAQVRELTEAGFLVPCIVHAPRDGKLRPDQLAREPAEAYLEKTPNGRAVCFAPHEKAARDYAAGFRAAAIPTGVVLGSTPDADRERILNDFAEGRLRVLCNVFVLTEGWDCPPADTCIIARGCQSASMFLQMIGRVLRAFPGKREAHLLDLRGVTYDHGAPDEERIFTLDGRGINRRTLDGSPLCRVCKEPLPESGTCPYCGAERQPQKTPKGMGVALDRYAGMTNLGPDKRVQVLAGILRGKGKPRSTKQARFIYQRMFKHYPTNAQMDAALRLIGGAP